MKIGDKPEKHLHKSKKDKDEEAEVVIAPPKKNETLMGVPVGMFDMIISSPRVSMKPSHIGKTMNMSVDSR